jgi:hypothetical protein
MASRFTELVIDAHDHRRLARFWAEVLGYKVIAENDEEVEIAGWDGEEELARSGAIRPTLLFTPVPEGKTVKNRVHIDVSPTDRDQQAEVERLIGLGATRVDIGQGEQTWEVLADPEGNEFCVLRGRPQTS